MSRPQGDKKRRSERERREVRGMTRGRDTEIDRQKAQGEKGAKAPRDWAIDNTGGWEGKEQVKHRHNHKVAGET